VKLTLSYQEKKSFITVKEEVVEVKPFQAVVWVSVSSEEQLEWDERTPKIPAILDTGNNHNFSITETQLAKWAGIQRIGLPSRKHMRERGKAIPLHSATLWLHAGDGPFHLVVDDGIAVYEGDWPRLPTLGLRALTNNKLQTFIYSDTMRVVIRTPPAWFWPF
jgi:hypothetical protein